MGASCFKSVEVMAIDDAKNYIIPLVVEELRTKIIPDIIHALQMTETNLDSSLAQYADKEINTE